MPEYCLFSHYYDILLSFNWCTLTLKKCLSKNIYKRSPKTDELLCLKSKSLTFFIIAFRGCNMSKVKISVGNYHPNGFQHAIRQLTFKLRRNWITCRHFVITYTFSDHEVQDSRSQYRWCDWSRSGINGDFSTLRSALFFKFGTIATLHQHKIL